MLTPQCPNLLQVKKAGDFEGVVSFGFGLRRMTGFRVFRLTNPTRVVIDVAHEEVLIDLARYSGQIDHTPGQAVSWQAGNRQPGAARRARARHLPRRHASRRAWAPVEHLADNRRPV